MDNLISVLVQCLIGWLLIAKVPGWLSITGFFATLIKIVGVLVILSALLSLV